MLKKTGRSRISVGEASVMKKGTHCTRGPYKSAWQCMMSLDEWGDDFGQPSEDSLYPVINMRPNESWLIFSNALILMMGLGAQ